MPNDGWGKEWPKTDAAKEDWGRHNAEWPVSQKEVTTIIYSGPNMFPEINHVELRVDCKDSSQLIKQGSNLVDAEAYLYFQCESCQDILDPHTKSFKILQERRADAKWKCIWNTNGLGYKVYCPKCGDEK